MFLKIFYSILLVICVPFSAYGYSYEHISSDNFVSIHILTVNPNEHLIAPVKATEEGVEKKTVAAFAKQHGAVAAINGGFWKLDGAPAGVLKINHQWLGTPVKPRGAIGWSAINHKVLIDRILTNYSLKECPVNAQIDVIPFSTSSAEWNEMEHIVGGAPVLVHKGHIVEDFSPEQTRKSFLTKKHPRTAVGIKDNGDWVFVVIDGRLQGMCRFLGTCGGMTMNKLAQLMLDLGCREALNLDGGGSSTMVIKGNVVNVPCGNLLENGKTVRAISDAILIY